MASYSAVHSSSRQDLHNATPGGYSDEPMVGQEPLAAGSGKRRSLSPWVKFGVPIAILVIIGAVLGGVLGSRAARNNDSSRSSTSSGGSSSSGDSSPAAASSAVSAKNALGIFATSTNSEFMVPVYPSTTNAAVFTTPTFNTQQAEAVWPEDPFQPSNPAPTSVRTDRPRLIAPAYKWQALPTLIAKDPYLKAWNDTIFGNASTYAAMDVVGYVDDGGNGILDVAREIKERIKAFSYAYRMTNDTKWSDRAYAEMLNAGSDSWGPSTDKWNTNHFLDTAELSAAYGIGYDWLYESLNDTQKEYIRDTMTKWGLAPGLQVFEDNASFGWWSAATIKGNWNCVCNGGLTLGALAILGDDDGTAAKLLSHTIGNAQQACVLAPSPDGTWAETANYWYFGTTGMAEMSSALQSATGSDHGLLAAGSGVNNTALYHMYVTGATSLFNYGDHGPNKFSTTANMMHYFATQFKMPQYSLFQRDRFDSASDPWAMFWYDPSVTGAWWDGLALDHYFGNDTDQWASMRSSWTDINALYVAVKAGQLTGHQAHNDLDAGDFVLDAMGTRWAGELGSGDYLSTGYFTSDAQDAQRWLYYRKRTEGQNTILVGQGNQDVTAKPSVKFESSGESQGSSTVYDVPKGSAAYFTADLTSAYFNTTSFKRGVRTINARRQVLIQDEINASAGIQWRMHTNATVTIDSAGTTATLSLDGKTMKISLLNGPSGAKFSTMEPVRFSSDPALPSGQTDQANPGVTVLAIELDAGSYTLEVLFNPQWDGFSDFATPSSVALDSWSLTSHP